MVGIVILNAVLVAMVLTAVVGILAWGIVSSIETGQVPPSLPLAHLETSSEVSDGR
jgi:hypothetical protein